ncbi:MAG: hypothetical protein ACRENG_32840, partial [bacterium]
MTEFTTSYLTELTASLSAEILKGIGRKLHDAIIGTEKERAVERCVKIGLAALLAASSAGAKEDSDQLETIFRKFFAEEDVGRELGALLRGDSLKRDELLYLFEKAGFDATTLPGVSFERALTAFEATFLIAATDERELQGTIQTNVLLTQLQKLGEIGKSMRDLVDFMRQARAETLAIHHGSITAQSSVRQQIVVYQLPYLAGAPTVANWEGHYLRTLISQCEPLDLTAIDETYASGEAGAISVSEVFTTLYLARLTRFPKQNIEAAIRRQDDHDVRKQM